MSRAFWTIKMMLQSIILLVIEIAALCIPALINGWPLLFYGDTRGYYRVGAGGVDKFISLFDHHSNPALDALGQRAQYIRSIYYSLFVYLPSYFVSIWLVIILQALIVALVLRLMFALFCPAQPRWQATLWIVFLAAATSVSFAVSNVMPDIFTAVMILSLLSLMLFWGSIGVARRSLLLVAFAGSMVMHTTNPPIALGVLVICWLLRRRQRNHAGRYVVGAIGAGLAATLLISFVGFKQWTLTPHAPPFIMATSVGDGPGRLYLREHCPQIKSVMCGYLDYLDGNALDFLWGISKPSVYEKMTSDEQTRLRAEEGRIFVAAALEHPWMQGKGIVENTLIQLALFTSADYRFPSHATLTRSDMTIDGGVVPESTYPGMRWVEAPWRVAIDIPRYLLVVAAVLGGFFLWAKGRLDRNQRDLFLMIIVAIMLNALVAGVVFPASRYQTRVVWLIPMATSLFIIKRKADQRMAAIA